MQIDRRKFLRGGGGFLALAALPGWAAACARIEGEARAASLAPQQKSTGGDLRPSTDGADPLADVRTEARSIGRPVLVFLVPRGVEARAERGRLLGSFLNTATRAELVDLALCRVVCASVNDVRRSLGRAAEGVTDATLAVLVETDGAAHAAIEGTPPALPPGYLAARVPTVTELRAFEAAVRARNAYLAQRVHAQLLPDEVAVARRAEQNLASLRAHERAQLLPPGERVEPTPGHALRLPAWVYTATDPLDRDLLAGAAIKALRDLPPSGSHWARNGGCGLVVEGENSTKMYACGRGHVPALSHRFLLFLTKDD